MPPGASRHTATDDYRAKVECEIARLAHRIRPTGVPLPLGDPLSGVMLVVEQPAGERTLDALTRSLRAVNLPNAYVTFASTDSLLQEILAAEPHVLAAIGPGAAAAIDLLDYPLARARFAEATEGEPFLWTKGTLGLRLPPLTPALHDEAAKRHFWRSFLALKAIHHTT